VSTFLERIYYDYDVTFGIKPKCAETGYGYIEADGEDLRSFREKLDKAIILDGVEDLIIVQTEDATIIMRRGQSQKGRDVLNTLSCLAKSYRQKSAYRGTDRSPCSRPKFFCETRMAYEGLYRSRYKARLRDRVWSDALISTGMTISACWSKKSTSAVPFDSQ